MSAYATPTTYLRPVHGAHTAGIYDDLAFLTGSVREMSRDESLLQELRFVEPAFGNLAGLARDYARSFPAASRVELDAERMLDWIETTFDLNDRQRDYISCRRARRNVEKNLTERSHDFANFTALRDVPVATGRNQPAHIHLNPTRVWNRLLTDEFLMFGAKPPCNALFFAVEEGVTATIFELEGQVLLNELAEFQPCTVETWTHLSSLGGRDQLQTFCQDLCEMGLAAMQ